jgi:hypothetical protein
MRARTPAIPGLLILATVLAVASPLQAQAPGETGFEGVRFGDTSDALVERFDARATRLDRPLDFGDSYVDVVLRRYPLGGYPFIVYFQMDKTDHRLRRIQIERPRHGAVAMVHRAAVAALSERYGTPTHMCAERIPRPGGHAIDERVWRRADVTVRLVFRERGLGVWLPRPLGVYDWEEWEPSLEGGLPQQLFVRIAPAGSERQACGG